MPIETKDAIVFAYTQTFDDGTGKQVQITKDTATELVDKVREYFNTNKIVYNTFSYTDLQPYL